MSALDDVKKEIPHVIVLALLVLFLLVILTKFGWIRCTQIPQWCDIYCNLMGKSHVGAVYGGEGLGNPTLLRDEIVSFRLITVIDAPLPISQASLDLLKKYDLIILEQAKKITPRQAEAFRMYVLQGGTIIWIGDSASSYYLSPEELMDLKFKNETNPGIYEEKVDEVNKTRGFGPLENILFASYIRTEKPTAGLTFHKVMRDHFIMQGLIQNFSMPTMPYAVVQPKPQGTAILAVLRTKEGKEYPAILETRYGGGKIIYISFPIEELPRLSELSGEKLKGKYLLTNIIDYLIQC